MGAPSFRQTFFLHGFSFKTGRPKPDAFMDWTVQGDVTKQRMAANSDQLKVTSKG
jgi:hypothetical protein